MEVGVTTHTLYCTYCLGSNVQIPQRKNNLPALFPHSHDSFWIPVSCSQVALYFILQRHTSCLPFLSETSSPCGMTLALDWPLCCIERAGRSEGPQDCANVVLLLPSFTGLGPPSWIIRMVFQRFSLPLIQLQQCIPSFIQKHPSLKPFNGTTVSIKSKFIYIAYRVL